MSALRLYCEVDASYLLHPESKDHTGYNISFFYGTIGNFHNRSIKQTAVATSSIHAEARAILTLAIKLNFIIAMCQELRIPLELPAIIMEDNSAVVTMANSESGYTKKCKHFLMVLNDRLHCYKSRLGRSMKSSTRPICTPSLFAPPNSSLWRTRSSAASRHHRLLLHWTQANLPLPLSLPRK